MRLGKERWYASLLLHPVSATKYIRENFSEAKFRLIRRETKQGFMIRNIQFTIDGKTILRARSVIDLKKTHPQIVKMLRETNKPLAEIILGFRVRRTRMRSTTRTGQFHYLGDVHAKVWERFYSLPKIKSE